MGKTVAVEGDVQAIPGTTPFTGAANGAWAPGSITLESYKKLTSGGKKVIYKATCTFNFTGVSPPPANSPVSGSETVVLEAKKTTLNASQSFTLLNGEKQQGRYGNTLQVISAQVKLISA